MPTVTPLPPRRPDAAPPAPPGAASAAPAVAAMPGPVPAAPVPSPPASVLPNPALRLDASLGLVVLEFRDADGQARTIPSQRELDAYREAARGAGQVPEDRPRAAPVMPGGEMPGGEMPAAEPPPAEPRRGAAPDPAAG